MKKFKIPVSWEMYGYVEVEAKTAEKALEKALTIENELTGFPLPDNGEYIDDSFKIDEDMDLINGLNQ